MAHQVGSRNRADFSLSFENDNLAGTARSSSMPSNAKTSGGRNRSHLGELNVGALQNIENAQPHTTSIKSTSSPHKRHISFAGQFLVDAATPESLAEDLENFQIYSPEKDGRASVETNKVGRKRSLSQGDISPDSPHVGSSKVPPAPELPVKQDCAHFAASHSFSGPSKQESFPELLSDSGVRQAIQKHEARNFDWILSLPGNAGDLLKAKHLRRVCSTADFIDSASQERKVYFGCNLLRRRSASGSVASTYTLIATPLGVHAAEVERLVLQNQLAVTRQDIQTKATVTAAAARADMVDTFLTPEGTAPIVDVLTTEQNQVSPKALVAGLDPSTVDRSQSVPRSPCSSVSRIEDTLEELDKLEDQFEAVNRMVHVDRVPSPDKGAHTKATSNGTSTAKKPVTRTGPVRQKTNDPQVAPVRKPATPAGSATKAAGVSTAAAGGVAAGASNKRLSVGRPLSLLPPKPLARSSKPPTRPTFELPGEAVARRLKEQREARMSISATTSATPAPVPAAAAATQRKARLTKPPTIPTFELPGEAISRRKREEHEAKLRQQEEEERKRREFKARPIRMSITPSTLPRETATSRARQNRISLVAEHAVGGGRTRTAVPGGPANTRLSVVSSTSSSRSAGQQAPRGRGATLESPSATTHASRAASTSTGSVSGQRSTVSAEDVQYQKLRGKEIYQRDNVLSVDRDRERRDREAAAKLARQEAAERSRQLSREWAEKQKLRAKKVSIS